MTLHLDHRRKPTVNYASFLSPSPDDDVLRSELVEFERLYDDKIDEIATEKVYETWYSQAVTHLSTNQALRCLTLVIGREPVLST